MMDFLPFEIQLEHVIKLLVAAGLGGLIGLEREIRDKPAGFRTIILIGLGACIFSIISQSVVGDLVDPTRIAAQVVTGVGFLGAGAILRGRAGVFGMTTAATIWSVAAIGMAVGFDQYGLAVVATLVSFFVLFVFDVVEKSVGRVRAVQRYSFTTGKAEDAVGRMRDLFKDARLRTINYTWYEEDDLVAFDVVAKGRRSRHDQLREKLMLSEEYVLRRG